ncbi:hypothetical protein GGI43DRAFT_400316 [Trichoderma evansii]
MTLPDTMRDREVHPTHTWRAALCSSVKHQQAASSLILVLRSLPVATAAQSLSSDRGQPRPRGDNLADARSTMLRHDAADRHDNNQKGGGRSTR